MAKESAAALRDKTCQPCEGGVPPLTGDDLQQHLRELDGWELTDGGQQIRRHWVVRDFTAGVKFLQQVAEIAEQEGHHPDLHLTGYRNVLIELTTHAIGGLSENDFIVAAKIDALPVDLKQGS